MSRLTRRTLLKGGVAGLSSVILGPDFFWRCLGSEAAPGRSHVSLYTGRLTRGIPTTCGLCGAGCGLLAFVDEGRLIGLAGNPNHPYNRGALCAFGSAALQRVQGPCRIRKPLRRVGGRGEGHWEEISWEEALRAVTERMRRPTRVHAPGAHGLVICLRGGEATPLVERFLSIHPRGLLALADGHEACVETAAHRSFGHRFDGPVDLLEADRILNFGANPLGSIRRLVGAARSWSEGRDRGVAWITLDPRLSETAAASDAWIPLRPGTDGVFALSVAHQIVKNGWGARSLPARETDVDPDTLREMLAPWAPEKAGPLCDVPAERIRWVAETFATADRPVAIFGSGVTGRQGGLEDARTVLLLNVLVGTVGRGGGNRGFGNTEWRQPGPPYTENREVPVRRGTLFWDLRRRGETVDCLLSHDANPAVTDPDANGTARILRDPNRVSFHIALATGWNETARLADLVLPAANFLESWGLHKGSAGAGPPLWVGLQQPVCSRPGDGRSLDELLLEIARSLGGDWAGAFPFRDVEGFYRRLLARRRPEGASAGRFRKAKEQGFLPVESGSKPIRDVEEVRAGGVLAESMQSVRERAGRTKAGGPPSDPKKLILYTSPTRGAMDRPQDWVDEIDHAEPVLIHPKAAEGLGLCDGDRVMIKGPADEIETRVRLTEGIHPEAVAMAVATFDRGSENACPVEDAPGERPGAPGRWWEKEAYGGNARRVVPWPRDPHRESPGWMDTRVTLKRLGNKA